MSHTANHTPKSSRRVGVALAIAALAVTPILGCGSSSYQTSDDSESWYQTGKDTLDYQWEVSRGMYSDY